MPPVIEAKRRDNATVGVWIFCMMAVLGSLCALEIGYGVIEAQYGPRGPHPNYACWAAASRECDGFAPACDYAHTAAGALRFPVSVAARPGAATADRVQFEANVDGPRTLGCVWDWLTLRFEYASGNEQRIFDYRGPVDTETAEWRPALGAGDARLDTTGMALLRVAWTVHVRAYAEPHYRPLHGIADASAYVCVVAIIGGSGLRAFRRWASGRKGDAGDASPECPSWAARIAGVAGLVLAAALFVKFDASGLMYGGVVGEPRTAAWPRNVREYGWMLVPAVVVTWVTTWLLFCAMRRHLCAAVRAKPVTTEKKSE